MLFSVFIIALVSLSGLFTTHASQNKPNTPKPRPEVKGTCENMYGNIYFTVKHYQPVHHSSGSRGRHLALISYLKDLITCGYDDTDVSSALLESVFVVWANLGRLRNTQNSGTTEQMKNQTARFIESHFQNVTDIWDPAKFTEFWQCILQGPPVWQSHVGNPHFVPRCHTNPVHNQHTANITALFHHLQSNRQKREVLPDSKTASKYYNLAYANRMMCVYLDDIVSPNGRPATREEQVVLMVKYILLGYTFKDVDELCPVKFLHNVYKYGAQAKHPVLTEREVGNLVRNLHRFPNVPTEQPTVPTPKQTHNRYNQQSDITFSNGTNIPHTQTGRRSVWNHHSNSEGQSIMSWVNMEGSMEEPIIHQCLSSREIFRMFNRGHSRYIDVASFLDMCPVLLQQVMMANSSKASTHRHHTTTASSASSPSLSLSPGSSASAAAANFTPTKAPSDDKTKEYLYGSLSVFLISLCSFLGAAFLKFGNELFKHYLMGSLLALAVGCLVADAILHLLPEISGIEGGDDDSDDDGVLLPKSLQKLCVLIASIYGFFVLELYLSRHGDHGHSHGPQLTLPTKDETINIKECNMGQITSNDISKNNRQRDVNTQSIDPNCQQFRVLNNNIVVNNIDGATNSVEDIELPRDQTQQSETTLSRVNSKTSRKSVSNSKIAIAWMVIIGDGIHNFADGLAIGAAFSLNFTKGLSTAITVLCHELPHELGDFAVLVSAGMSIKRAMLFNFLSSLTAFAGLYIGLALGDQPEACQWIFSAGAGMFLYVAMADLIPEIKTYFKKTPDWKMFLGQNIGLLVGYLGMLLLAMFEDKIELQ